MKKITTLNKLKINQSGTIVNIDNKSKLKRRFEDLGIIKDEKISCELESIFKDPKAYLIKGCLIAIRNEDSKHIRVKVNDK